MSAVASAAGLTETEALERLATFGPNDLVPADPSGDLWTIVRSVVTDPMAALLVVASALYVVLGEVRDALVTSIALVPIVAVTVILEVRAERALAGLHAVHDPHAAGPRECLRGAPRAVHAAWQAALISSSGIELGSRPTPV